MTGADAETRSQQVKPFRRVRSKRKPGRIDSGTRAFGTVIRMALRYRWTLLGSFACSLMVGLLWGANVGTLYPVFEVVLYGRSLSDSIAERLEEREHRVAEFQREILELKATLRVATESQREELEARSNELAALLATEKQSRAAHQYALRLSEKYLPATPFATLVLVMAILLGATVLRGSFLAFSEILTDRVVQRTIFNLRGHLYSRILQLDLGRIQKERTSRLMSRITHDVSHINDSLSTLFGQAVREPLKLLACLAGAAFISWRLVLILIVVALPAVLLVMYLSLLLKKNAAREMMGMGRLYARLSESFGGIHTVQAFNMQRYEKRNFYSANREILERRNRVKMVTSFIKPLVEFASTGGVLVVILMGTHLLLSRETSLLGISLTSRTLDPSSLMVFSGFLIAASDPFRKLSQVFLKLRCGAVASKRVLKLASKGPTIVDPVNPQPLASPVNEIVFDKVRFRYPRGQLALRNIHLTIRREERIALIGPNGSGKTTLINLLLRFYDPKKGQIRFDGTDLRDVQLRELRDRVSVVAQYTTLFDDSVFNNIRYGSPHATRQQVEQAARDAFAHDFIQSDLNEGYETVLGERGCRLSGGQRQRIALARALLREPEFLILDEATSNVDMESEKLIYDAIDRNRRYCTVLIVNHRLTALPFVNRVILMDGGRIVRDGSREEVCELLGWSNWPEMTQEWKSRKSA